VVKAGSSINGNAHTVVNAAEIATTPLELRAFFVENSGLVKQRVVKSTDPKFFNPKKPEAAKPASSEHYSFYMKKSKFDEAVKLLDPTCWSDRSKWLKCTTACHALGHLGVWDKNNQLHPNNYGTYDRNLATWSVVLPPFCRLLLLTFPCFPPPHFLSPSQPCQVSTKVSRPSPVKRRRGSSPRSGEAGSHHTGSSLVQHPNSCGTR
jgi:hypothetical protein